MLMLPAIFTSHPCTTTYDSIATPGAYKTTLSDTSGHMIISLQSLPMSVLILLNRMTALPLMCREFHLTR
jgi:hypothetical protein